jgi:hypothetical protein
VGWRDTGCPVSSGFVTTGRDMQGQVFGNTDRVVMCVIDGWHIERRPGNGVERCGWSVVRALYNKP